ncbi:MAG: T9SS type A sorting domain-containing protein [Draconibacterium sp.]|nr:T9SS type A sorting domain-containing protein [Draconibacterium sp.]
MTQDLKVNKYNSRFIDVELSSALTECFSPDHPTTRRQDAESRTELLAFIKNFYRLVTGTEEAHDFAFQNLDYSEGTMTIAPAENAGYDWSQPLENTDKAYYEQNISTRYRIPLHGLVYHDVHIPTWYTGDGVSKVPAYWEDKDLWNILYGTMPLYLPPSRSYWDSNLEKFMSGYHLMSTVSRNVGYAKMINHQFLSEDHNLQETDFDNGWKVVVNFDSIPRNLAGKTLAPKGFYASAEEKDEAGKMIFDDKTIAWALSSNRLFFNPFGVEASKLGLRSTNSVFMEKFTDYLLVSFIGNQNYIDFNIDDLPFDVKEISKVVEYYTAREISLITTDDGWKQLRRPTGKSYFKLYYGPKTTRLETGSLSPGLKIYPNPAQNQLFIEHLNHNAQLTVCNINGQRLIEKSLSDSKSHIDIGFLASGVYFLKVVQNGSSEVLKFIKN